MPEAAFPVSVAMATFDGARFIGEQLESLARQSLPPAEIVVADDGSTDATLAIVADFAARAPFPVRVSRNPRRLGFADNFLHAAAMTTAPWVAFCDQDDVWETGKLAAVAAAVAGHAGVRLVTHPSLLMRDGVPTGAIEGLRAPGAHPPRTLHPLNTFHGHSLVFDRTLLEVLPPAARPFSPHTPDRRMPHDDWITFLANALGTIVVLAEPLVRYRLHGGNASAAATRRSGVLDQLRRGSTLDATDIEKHWRAAVNRAAQMRLVGGAAAPQGRVAAAYYDKVAGLLAERLVLWRTGSMLRRAPIAARLLWRGAYRDFQHGGMGSREMLKDLVFGLRGAATPAAAPDR